MADLQFALIREGTSDDGLITHIRELLVRAGATAVIGASRQYKGSTKERLQDTLGESPIPTLIFVHRDADSVDDQPRHREIATAAEELGCAERVVAVVPVQELEAWLLTDEAAIRSVVGRPNGRAKLGLPPPRSIEKTSSPKEILQAACLDASEKTGARLKKEKTQFSNRRATLLERLEIDGSVSSLPSWQRFVADLNDAARRVLSDPESES